MKFYAILRCATLSSVNAVNASEKHALTEHDKVKTLTDKTLTECNKVYENEKYIGMKLNKVFELRTKGLKRKPRKDAVRIIETVLTFSPGFLTPYDAKELDLWAAANLEFIKGYFGADNFVRAVLHLDEATPHIHIYTTCITKDGRNNANDFLGGHVKLSQLQTKYADAMEPFGLARGYRYADISNMPLEERLAAPAPRRHKKLKEYRAEQKGAIQGRSIADEVLSR